MAQFVAVPVERLSPESLRGLLEEFASRDGTDYGDRETPLAERVEQLRAQLDDGSLSLLFDVDSETWDLVAREQAQEFLDGGRGAGVAPDAA